MMSAMPAASANELLGYPAGARLLVVNADDLGMYPEVNEGIARAFQAGVVRSTSLMVPCPAARPAMRWLADHPEVPFGIHLTLVCDLPGLRWGPVSPAEEVPSLVDGSGRFRTLATMPEWLPRLRLDDVGREFRAQLQAVREAGLSPVHLDWHCTVSGGRDDIFELTWELAREHHLSLRVADPRWNRTVQARGLPAADDVLLDSFDLPVADKPAHYARLLRDLPAGLSMWAVHPAVGDASSRSVDPDGWEIRHSDLEFLESSAARETIGREGIVLLGHREVHEAWQARARGR